MKTLIGPMTKALQQLRLALDRRMKKYDAFAFRQTLACARMYKLDISQHPQKGRQSKR